MSSPRRANWTGLSAALVPNAETRVSGDVRRYGSSRQIEADDVVQGGKLLSRNNAGKLRTIEADEIVVHGADLVARSHRGELHLVVDLALDESASVIGIHPRAVCAFVGSRNWH